MIGGFPRVHLTGTDAAACVAATATAGACPVVDLAVREEGPAPKAGGGLAGNVRRVRGGGELLLWRGMFCWLQWEQWEQWIQWL